MKISVIEEMLYGEIHSQWEERAKFPESQEVYGELGVLSKKLSDALNEEQKMLLNEYTSAIWGVSSAENKKSFSLGARFGLFFALELLENDIETDC